MKLKMSALILALALILGCFTACGEGTAAPSADVSPSPEITEAVETDDAAVSEPDKYDLALAAYEPDAVVMTVNGEDVTWKEYFYWIYNIAYQFGDVDWSEAIDDKYTYQSYAQYYAESMISQYWVVAQKAQELELELTEEEQAQVDAIYEEDVATYGGGDEEKFKAYIEQLHIPLEMYNKMNAISVYYLKIFENYFGEMGAELPDEDALSYANDAGYMHAKHILLKTLDDEGGALEEEAAAEKLATAQELLAQLQGIADAQERAAKFDELMNEYSEDTGLAYYPNGYYFITGEMVEEFENATLALEENGLSDIVETDYGYHIILRLPMELDEAIDYNGYTMRYMAASALFENMSMEWFEAAEIEYTDEFAALDFNQLFGVTEIGEPEEADGTQQS